MFGLEKIMRVLAAAMREGAVAHAYLFYGAEGSGKKTLALCFASALTCALFPAGPCGDCRSCRKAAVGANPDIHLVLPEGRSLRIDQVRQVRKAAYLRPHESRCQVFILEAATVTPEAANSMLKVLEEPPAGTIFLLLAENPATLPPTVVSRCQQFALERLSPDQLRKILQEAGTPPENRELAVRLAEGLPGRALAAAGMDMGEQLAGAASFLNRLADRAGISQLAAELEANKESVVFFDLLLTLLRDMFVLTVTGRENCLICYECKTELEILRKKWPAARCREALSALLELRESLQSSGNIRLACERALRRIREVS
jgi:DNA polymerase-3 subunit delta'